MNCIFTTEAERHLVILSTGRTSRFVAGEQKMTVPLMSKMSEISAKSADLETNLLKRCSGTRHSGVITQISKDYPLERERLSGPKRNHCTRRVGEKDDTSNKVSEPIVFIRKAARVYHSGRTSKSYVARTWRKQARQGRKKYHVRRAKVTKAVILCIATLIAMGMSVRSGILNVSLPLGMRY